jgi:hypothetical protein
MGSYHQLGRGQVMDGYSLSVLDRLVQVLLSVVIRSEGQYFFPHIKTGDIRSGGLVGGKVLGTLVRDHVELSIDPFSLVVDHLQGVTVVTVHLSPS